MTPFKKILISGAVLLATATSAQAAKGFVIEETASAGGDPEKKVTYATDTALRMEEGDKITVFTLRGGTVKLYEISPKAQVAVDKSPMAAMMVMGNFFFLEQDGKGGVRPKKDFFTPTDETKVVGKWKARKLLTTVMGLQSGVWYTRDSQELLDADRMRMTFFAKANEAIMKPQLEGAPAESRERFAAMTKALTAFVDQTQKEYGAQVLSEMKMGGMSATTQLVSVRSADNADSLFVVPKGYKLQPFDPTK